MRIPRTLTLVAIAMTVGATLSTGMVSTSPAGASTIKKPGRPTGVYLVLGCSAILTFAFSATGITASRK